MRRALEDDDIDYGELPGGMVDAFSTIWFLVGSCWLQHAHCTRNKPYPPSLGVFDGLNVWMGIERILSPLCEMMPLSRATCDDVCNCVIILCHV